MNFLSKESVLRHACEAFNQQKVLTAFDEPLELFPTGMEAETGEIKINSMITAPIVTRGDEVLGVIQLFNPDREEMDKVDTSATQGMDGLLGSLVAQAAVGLDNRNLVGSLEELLDSVIRVIASSIDAKSPYTAGHCTRVPELAVMLTRAVHDSKDGTLADFKLESEDEWRQMWLASWMHDCGKVTTPEYVVDKATKLETIYDRIHEVRNRFEILYRDAELEYYRAILDGGDEQVLNEKLEETRKQLKDDFDFIADCNIGGEFMSDDKKERVQEIAQRTWMRHFSDRIGVGHLELGRKGDLPEEQLPAQEKLLDDKPEHIIARTKGYDHIRDSHGNPLNVPEHEYNRGELYNLCISRGTLTNEERFKINEHMLSGIEMLNQIPFPDRLNKVTEIATGHHETLAGTGYPLKKDRDTLSVETRILAIADIFEALTASDRPYKKAKKLSEALRIMTFMRKDEHIDAEVFDIFLRKGVYKEYAEKHLAPEQMDVEDISMYLSGADS